MVSSVNNENFRCKKGAKVGRKTFLLKLFRASTKICWSARLLPRGSTASMHENANDEIHDQ